MLFLSDLDFFYFRILLTVRVIVMIKKYLDLSR